MEFRLQLVKPRRQDDQLVETHATYLVGNARQEDRRSNEQKSQSYPLTLSNRVRMSGTTTLQTPAVGLVT
jgi:hypothetical protein